MRVALHFMITFFGLMLNGYGMRCDYDLGN